MAQNYYETLGLPMGAGETEIAASLDRELVLVSNLERVPSRQAEADARRQALQQIRQTLLSPTTRSKYDAYLSAIESANKPQIGFAAPEMTPVAPMSAPDKAATVFCSACGRPSRNSAKFCSGCGASIPLPLVEPTTVSLSEPWANSSAAAGAPHNNLSQSTPSPASPDWAGLSTSTVGRGASGHSPSELLSPPSQPPVRSSVPNWSGLSTYYQTEFRKIYESGESYKGKWNWAAFLFGGIWALTKGVWLPVVICIVASIVTGGIAGLVYWIIFAARGNYMYYSAQTKGKQILV